MRYILFETMVGNFILLLLSVIPSVLICHVVCEVMLKLRDTTAMFLAGMIVSFIWQRLPKLKI